VHSIKLSGALLDHLIWGEAHLRRIHQNAPLTKMRRFFACPSRKHHPEIVCTVAGPNSLFSRANSLFFRKNSLFC
jgi:hypothetical protein